MTPQILEKGKRFRSIWILLYFVSYIVFSFIGVILIALLVNSNVQFFLNLPVDLLIFSAIWLLYLWIVPLLLIRVYLLSFNDLANILTYLKNRSICPKLREKVPYNICTTSLLKWKPALIMSNRNETKCIYVEKNPKL